RPVWWRAGTMGMCRAAGTHQRFAYNLKATACWIVAGLFLPTISSQIAPEHEPGRPVGGCGGSRRATRLVSEGIGARADLEDELPRGNAWWGDLFTQFARRHLASRPVRSHGAAGSYGADRRRERMHMRPDASCRGQIRRLQHIHTRYLRALDTLYHRRWVGVKQTDITAHLLISLTRRSRQCYT